VYDTHPNSQDKKTAVTLVAIVGPTAVGKSEVAIRIAPELNAEIISVDSMQVYRGMDIGTSKPGQNEREKVRTHMIDIVDPGEDFSVAVFKEMAERSVRDIVNRGNLPILVGGSGLYYRAVVDDLDFTGVEGDGINGRASAYELSGDELYETLHSLDPAAASEIDISNRKRVIRAIEVARGGGRLISSRQDSWIEYKSPYRLIAVGLEMERSLLYGRIDRRVDRMFSMGLVSEVQNLQREGLGLSCTAGATVHQRQFVTGGSYRRDKKTHTKVRETSDYMVRQRQTDTLVQGKTVGRRRRF